MVVAAAAPRAVAMSSMSEPAYLSRPYNDIPKVRCLTDLGCMYVDRESKKGEDRTRRQHLPGRSILNVGPDLERCTVPPSLTTPWRHLTLS